MDGEIDRGGERERESVSEEVNSTCPGHITWQKEMTKGAFVMLLSKAGLTFFRSLKGIKQRKRTVLKIAILRRGRCYLLYSYVLQRAASFW